MTTPSKKQKRFIINTTVKSNANKVNTEARSKSKLATEKANKDCKTRRDIERHMDQRRLKQELADFGIMDEILS